MSGQLEVVDFAVSYGKVRAVQDIVLSIDAGQAITVIGPNGAGKSTLLNGIIGLLPSSGRVVFEGEDVSGLDVEDRIRIGLCLVPERRELFGDLAVSDNLLLGGHRSRWDRNELKRLFDHVYGHFPRLAERRKQLAATLSGGERQMLALGRALMTKPRLLMLDEPSLGLAPLLVKEIFRIIADLRTTGVSILLVEQNARAALETVDYGYVLENGQISFHGDAPDLINDQRVMETYLGSKQEGMPVEIHS